MPSTNDLFILLRNLDEKVEKGFEKSEEQRDSLKESIDALKETINNRLTSVEKKVDQHEHTFATARSLMSWGPITSFITAGLAWYLGLFGGHKP